ncbi:beta-ketoacyl synthase N-terminal-like domain-containing protein [Nonomuraea sp. SBT364]|uniref:beta-ketoacyl synthase N-terminal-like domain-containing protein n=1 Tax=Nonomuraea sp. SBT364 TaxID=1580530 RepID=UPI00069E2465|nr:beta-ketoacyl synthase N-terminal-like domain-containing protein [Nonomuraea sp. SBT364]
MLITGVGTAIRGVAGPADLLRPAVQEGSPDPTATLTGRGLRYKDRATKLALCAGRDALADAGLLLDPGLTVPGESVGVVVSSNYGNLDTVCDTVSAIAGQDYTATSPMSLPGTASNVTASWVAISYGLRGVNLTLCDGANSGLDAVSWASVMIQARRVRHMLVIGVEPANPVVDALVGPTFDGAAALVLESAETARERGARAMARLGRHARRESHARAVGDVLEEPVDLWCRPDTTPGHPVESAREHDLTALLGPASGALGVVQCVAAASWLETSDGGTVLASTHGVDAASAVVLTGAGR